VREITSRTCQISAPASRIVRRTRRSRTSAPVGAEVNSQGHKPLETDQSQNEALEGRRNRIDDEFKSLRIRHQIVFEETNPGECVHKPKSFALPGLRILIIHTRGLHPWLFTAAPAGATACPVRHSLPFTSRPDYNALLINTKQNASVYKEHETWLNRIA